MTGFMLRKPIAVLLVVAVLCPGALAATPEASLELGLRAFRAGDFTSAVTDLDDAARAFAPSELQTYVETGRMERLPAFETALVYLALAQFRLGREDESRETILRLIAADTLGGAYATLPLQSDATDFETLVAALVPASTLPHNAHAELDPSMPLPAVRPVAEHGVAVTPEEVRAVRQLAVNEYVTRENERLQRAAGAEIQIAELPPRSDGTVAQPTVTEVPVAETPIAETPTAPVTPTLTAPSIVSVERRADERVAEAQEEAARRIAAAETEARQRIVAAEVAAQQAREAAEAEAAKAQREADARVAAMQQQSRVTTTTSDTIASRGTGTDSAAVRAALGNLRQAEALADNGEFEAADAMYQRLAESAPREVVVLAAIGLYRNGAYRDAVNAFGRVGAFARGEEDLHYYYAVSLYEAGQYEAARKELACALPFIQVTDEVMRYRLKIEQTMAQLTSTRF